MSDAYVTMAANGRLVIPSDMRAQLGMRDGGAFVARVEDGVIRLEPIGAVVRRVQANVRRYVPEGAGLVDELLAERRREAEGE